MKAGRVIHRKKGRLKTFLSLVETAIISTIERSAVFLEILTERFALLVEWLRFLHHNHWRIEVHVFIK